ncbi:HAD hydrolase-like protein [Streptomyces sp. S.PNR 29]|nr:HAD family hydrolase [Streptomyces sp. S.PNR 29]MDN0197339.1 HAD hydrolase-like protein [Streptomyces sp. S.PNR 29]
MRTLIASAQAVLFGFDGTVCRLFSGHSREYLAREYAAWLRARGLGALLPAGDVIDPYALPDYVSRRHPGSDLVRELQERLTAEELRAVSSAFPNAYADPVLRSLRAMGMRVAVATPCSARTVRAYLESRGLASVVEHVSGRGTTPEASLLPDVVRALAALGTSPARALMIGATPADFRASREAGVPFLGLAHNDRAEAQLRSEGADLVVPSLEPVLSVIRDISAGPPPAG